MSQTGQWTAGEHEGLVAVRLGHITIVAGDLRLLSNVATRALCAKQAGANLTFCKDAKAIYKILLPYLRNNLVTQGT